LAKNSDRPYEGKWPGSNIRALVGLTELRKADA
jgi:hypothetical protein